MTVFNVHRRDVATPDQAGADDRDPGHPAAAIEQMRRTAAS